MRQRLCVSLALSAAAFLLVVGCSNNPYASVNGTVTIDGKDVENGAIEFERADGTSTVEGAPIKDGKYAAAKVPIGELKVRIRASKVIGEKETYGPGSPKRPIYAEMLPDKYNNRSTLRFDVQPGANTKDWELSTNDLDQTTK